MRCCAPVQSLTARRSRRMLFNWVLWRYTILYINERSWESGGVARPRLLRLCLFRAWACLFLCSATWLVAWRHPGGWAPLRSPARRQIWRHFCQALIWCFFIFGVFTGAPPCVWRPVHASPVFRS